MYSAEVSDQPPSHQCVHAVLHDVGSHREVLLGCVSRAIALHHTAVARAILGAPPIASYYGSLCLLQSVLDAPPELDALVVIQAWWLGGGQAYVGCPLPARNDGHTLFSWVCNKVGVFPQPASPQQARLRDVVTLMCEAGLPHPAALAGEGRSNVEWAVRAMIPEAVRAWVQSGEITMEDLNSVDDSGRTASARVCTWASQAPTALTEAQHCHASACATALLGTGMLGPETPTGGGMTHLHLACKSGMQELVERWAADGRLTAELLQARSGWGQTAFSNACLTAVNQTATQGERAAARACAQALFRTGHVQPDTMTYHGFTHLHWACYAGLQEAVECWVRTGQVSSDLINGAKTTSGATPFAFACIEAADASRTEEERAAAGAYALALYRTGLVQPGTATTNGMTHAHLAQQAGVVEQAEWERAPDNVRTDGMEGQNSGPEEGKSDAVLQRFCAVCAARSSSRCPRCKITWYCSEKCQHAAWPLHKKRCEQVDKEAAEAPVGGPIVERNGLVGLANLGSTSYMNSALQALSAVWPLTRYLLVGGWEGDVNPDKPESKAANLAKAYATLMQSIWLTDAASVSPAPVKMAIITHSPRFSGVGTHDAHDLLESVLDALHDAVNAVKIPAYVEDEQGRGRPDALVAALSLEKHRRRHRSLIQDSFCGQLKNTHTCPKCQQVSVKFQPYLTVPLPIPGPGDAMRIPSTSEIVGKRPFEVLLSRIQWDPAHPEVLQPGARKEGWQGIDQERPKQDQDALKEFIDMEALLPAAQRHDKNLVAEVGNLGFSASYSNVGRFERYCVMLEGEYATAEEILAELTKQCGVPANRMMLQILRRSVHAGEVTNGTGVQTLEYYPVGTRVKLTSLTKAYGWIYKETQQVLMLNAVEVLSETWRLPAELAPAPVLAKFPGAEAEAAAEQRLLDVAARLDSGTGEGDTAHKKAALLEAEKAFVADRDPLKPVLLLTRMAARKLGANGAPGDLPVIDIIKKSLQQVWADPTQPMLELTPLVVNASAGMTVAQLRMQIARDLFASLGGAARGILEQAGELVPPGPASAGQVLLYIASQILIGVDEREEVGWLPTIGLEGEDCPVSEEGVKPGVRLLAGSTPLGDVIPLHVFRSTDGVQAPGSMSTFTNVVWGRISVVIRNKLALAPQHPRTGWSQRANLPALLHMADLPSWTVCKRMVDNPPEDPGSVTLDMCFDKLRTEEVLDKDNTWYCSTCKEHVQARKKTELWSLPDILVLQLKRFTTVRYRVKKLDTLVDFPLRQLDLSAHHLSHAYTQQPEEGAPGNRWDPRWDALEGVELPPPAPFDPDNSVYDCTAVVQHHGTHMDGHCTASANHAAGLRGAAEEAGQWHVFDDAKCSPAEAEAVVSRGAYILVYRRRKQLGRAV